MRMLAQVEVNEVVECLMPFSGRANSEDLAPPTVLPPPPRLLDVASALLAHELLLSGDPDGDGLYFYRSFF